MCKGERDVDFLLRTKKYIFADLNTEHALVTILILCNRLLFLASVNVIMGKSHLLVFLFKQAIVMDFAAKEVKCLLSRNIT